jgi:hypothetical protein
MTPKSLRALSVQLKLGYPVMAIMMQMRAKMGATIPFAAPIRCKLLVLESDKLLIPQQF